jgi:anti-sigma factor RsiW
VNRDRAEALMMAALDGEIAPGDRRELDDLIAAHPDLAAEWRRLTRVKEVTAGMSLRKPPEETWDRYWQSTYRRTERGLAWILLSAGALVLLGYWLWHAAGSLLEDSTTPPLLRAAIVAVGLGLAILAVSVIREKLFTNRRDPYQKEIIR